MHDREVVERVWRFRALLARRVLARRERAAMQLRAQRPLTADERMRDQLVARDCFHHQYFPPDVVRAWCRKRGKS